MSKSTLIICNVAALVVGGIAILLGVKYRVTQRVDVVVARTQWGCRTMVQESYESSTFVMVGKVPMMLPQTSWRDVTYSDAFGEGFAYACPRFKLGNSDQREVFTPSYFITFADQCGKAYPYRVESYEEGKAFVTGSRWTLGLSKSGEIMSVR